VGADQEGVGVVQIEPAATEDDWVDAARLVRAYLAGLPFEVDFQADVDDELAHLSTAYGGPDGILLLGRDEAGRSVGVVGVKRFDDDDAELKRMYLEPGARGSGLGRALADAAIVAARGFGYRRLLLDTVSRLTAAVALYESLGFVEIGAYRHNPLEDARYFALDLAPP
jgi:GNAT superfamily N-acetyltransferase